jgi:hypothetical protein
MSTFQQDNQRQDRPNQESVNDARNFTRANALGDSALGVI